MKRGVLYYLVEIIILIFIIFFTYYLIDNCSYNNKNMDLALDNNLSISIVKNNNNYLRPMSDNYAINNMESTVINIKNYNRNDVDYKLFMRIKRDNELDFNELKIKVDDDIFRLNSKYDYEKDGYMYFDLVHKNVDSVNNVNFVMWLDENIDDYSNYSFLYDFYIERI